MKGTPAPERKVRAKKTTHNRLSKRSTLKTNMPAILTFLIAFMLLSIVIFMTLSHSLGPQDRQFLSLFSGTFSAAFATACGYWFKESQKSKSKK